MLVIRFLRVGKKKQPSYKIVVTDKRNPASAGRFVEQVGFYNPLTKEKVLHGERIKHWLSVGAKPSDTAYNLFISEKIIEGKKRPQHKKSKKQEEKPKEEASVKKESSMVTEKKEEVKEEKPVEAPKEEIKKEEAKVEEKQVEEPKEEVEIEKEVASEAVEKTAKETPDEESKK